MQSKKPTKRKKKSTELKTYSSYLTIRKLSDIYNLIYYKLYQNTRGWIDPKEEVTETKLTSFLLLLNSAYGISSIGTHFISEYLFYQFCYWFDKRTRYEMKLDWVIGKKALKRYQEASPENIYVCTQRMQELGVSADTIRGLLIGEDKKSSSYLDHTVNPTTEAAKTKISKEALFAYCHFQGLDYNKYSEVCLSCPSSLICKNKK